MRLINFSRPETPGRISLGSRWNNSWIDVTAASAAGILPIPGVELPEHPPATIEDILSIDGALQNLEKELDRLAAAPSQLAPFVLADHEVLLKSPLLNPKKILGIGLNYRDHAEEFKIPIPQFPIVFGMYANAIIGPGDFIVIPPATTQVDYEGELGVVIGKRALRVPVDKALEYVAGYTVFHDVSARDIQFGDKQWTRGKSIDTFAPMGPCLVTTSELGDGGGLGIQTRVNGRTLQKSNTRNLIFNVVTLVSLISQTMTLEPGDVIATGTPSGVGYVRNPPIFLKSGDTVEIEIEGIGCLKNGVTAL